MRIVVIGGTGLIGTKLCGLLREAGHEVVAASPSTGVNTLTGDGVAEAVAGAAVVVDVANSPSFADAEVLSFFERSSRTLLAAETAAAVAHHVVLSVIGANRVPGSGYLRAKVAQEDLVTTSGVPYTILRATQFYEFLGAIGGSATDGDTVRLPHALVQPLAADDVAAVLAELAVAAPAGGIVELAGPRARPLDELVAEYLAATGDQRRVITDETATYFGAPIDDHSLTPGPDARLGKTAFTDWLAQHRPAPTA